MALIRVVLADPAENWRSAACSFLEKSPTIRIVGIAADGPEARKLIRKSQPDVILMDVNLSEMTPFEACKLVRQDKTRAKLVVVTSNSDINAMNAAIAQGISGYVHKADFAAELAIALKMVMSGESFISSEMCKAISTKLSQFANP